MLLSPRIVAAVGRDKEVRIQFSVGGNLASEAQRGGHGIGDDDMRKLAPNLRKVVNLQDLNLN